MSLTNNPSVTAPELRPSVVAVQEQPGGLRNAVTMKIQTRQAQKLIAGRKYENGVNAIIGLLEFGRRVKQIWLSAEVDDPYADWYLVQIEDEMQAVKLLINNKIQWLQGLMTGMEGFTINKAESLQPVEMDISFQNPYGYIGAYLIHDYDVLAQLVFTARHIGLMDRQSAEKIMQETGTHIRRVFRLSALWKFTGVTREDLMGNNQNAQRACDILGECPESIVAGQKRAKLSPNIRRKPSITLVQHAPPNQREAEPNTASFAQ